MRILLFIFLFSFAGWGVLGQDNSVSHREIKSIGLPAITNYTPSDYDFTNQNFAILAGQDGRMYFGNYGGILIYDGSNWQKITLPGNAPVYGLAQTKDGRIYVGGTNEIGYLAPNQQGKLAYTSYMDNLVGDSLSSFTTRPSISDQNKVVFYCVDKMVLIDPDNPEIEVIPGPVRSDELSLYDPHTVGDEYFVYKNDTLLKLINKSWQSIKRSGVLSGRFGQGRVIELPNKQSIAITQTGFFDFKTEKKLSIPQETELFLSDAFIYDLNLLTDQYIAISTWKGLLITNLNGKPISFLDKSRGLIDNALFGTAVDTSGMLWVATNNGISKIDIFSPYSFLNENMGIESVVIDTRLFSNKLYVGTMSGLMTIDWLGLENPLSLPQFQLENRTVNQGFISSKEDLIVLTEWESNLYLHENTMKEIYGTDQEIYWNGFISCTEDHAFLGSIQGWLIHLIKSNNQWIVKSKVDPLFQVAQFMAEGEANDLWVGNDQEGVFKIVFDRAKGKILSEQKYGEADGLPSDFANYVVQVDDQPLISTIDGLYRYNKNIDQFSPDERFISIIGQQTTLPFTQDADGNIFYFADAIFQLKKQGINWTKLSYPKIDFKQYAINNIHVIDSANVLLATTNGVIHLDPRYSASEDSFATSITSIADLQNSDSIYYGGFGPLPNQLSFTPSQRSFRFGFSAQDYQNETKNLYQWKLDDFDDTWSEWSSEHAKDYTNLSHGTYTFAVKSMNRNGIESEAASIQFTIARPWYFTIWAYALYAVILGMGVWGIVLIYTRRLRAKNLQLEEKIEERTEEIRQQHNKLLEMDNLKRRFFVNISHELRTPLTLSMGTIDQALRGTYGQLNDELYANLKVSKSNSERLLKMVNNILDISKLEGGKIQLYTAPVDPLLSIQKVLAFFSSRFTDKQISLKEELIEGLVLFLDQDKFETILINLVSNAFKFTPVGGEISMSMTDHPDGLVLIVKDSGEGIPTADLSLVFDRFYQSPSTKSGEGTGVGLALTKELVELHHGTIQAENDQGAMFTLKFLKGKEHLSPNQMVEEPHETTHSLSDKYVLRDDPHLQNDVEVLDGVHGQHILLVEDNPEMRQFVGKILSANYKVSMVEDGKQGLEFLKNQQPDLIVTDYLMPNMDGYEMAMEIKQSEELAFIPLIFLTARAREQDKINVLNLGVDDYLFKPFSPEELMVRVKNLLARKQQRSSFVLQESIDPRDIEWKEFPSKLKLQVDEYLEMHLKEEITSENIASFTGQSDRTLYRKIKVNTGLSVMGYVKEYRLRKARTLLENQKLPTVSEISYAVGFNYLSHFTKSYTDRFGKNPSTYLE